MLLQDALRTDFDPILLTTSEGRKVLTKHDPLLFAAVYMPHKIKVGDNPISVNQFHLDICEYAKTWTKPLGLPGQHRDCFIAPRMCGKSTWVFHILPIWAAAHGHRRYIIAFSDSEDQAMAWLRNFKMELDSNSLLQEDYPGLTNTAKKSQSGKAYMDNRNATQRENGFVFQAKGVDSAILGANIGGVRPEVILFDDIEPPEANYGPTELKKRKSTILTTHLYLNTYANVAFVGTTTMAGSLVDQMRKVGQAWQDFEGDTDTFKGTLDPDHRWVVEANIKTHYYPAVIETDEGEASLWPEMWPLEDWDDVRGTREFAMNMMNKPISGDEGYWDDGDIEIDRTDYGNVLLTIDPAVTTARRSDYSAFAVIARGKDDRKIYVLHASQIKGDSDALREKARELIDLYGVGVVLVETNQGGNLWRQVFKGLPGRFKYITQRAKKEVRIAQAADLYKRGKVKHAKHFPVLEEQMLAYPNVTHDDLVDAVATGILYFGKSAAQRVVAKNITYMEVR